jgi:hypothetical protein
MDWMTQRNLTKKLTASVIDLLTAEAGVCMAHGLVVLSVVEDYIAAMRM